MRRLAATAVACLVPCAVFAQGTGDLTVSGDPPPLAIVAVGPGNQPMPATNATTTYSVTVLGLGLGINGQLDAPMPSGTTLRVALAAPAGATSLGPVTLGTTPQPLVRQLPVGTYSGMSIEYEFSALVTAGVVNQTSRTVTLTITAVP